MKNFSLLLILFCLFQLYYCDFTQEEKDALLQYHNNARANVNPPAEHMPNLVWDDTLAQIAQNWANKCQGSKILNHNSKRSEEYGSYVGENIYAQSGSPSTRPNIKNCVDLWVSEVKDYDFDSNTCSGVCGHYTQV